MLRADGFETATAKRQEQILSEAQRTFANLLRNIIDADPIEVRVKGRSAEAVIRDAIKQAEDKGKSGDVAQYLIGAKLMLRLDREIPVVPANKGDRRSRSDADARTGDFEIEDATIEIALGIPDDKHLSQIAEAHEDPELEVWLLTHHDRVASWMSELPKTEGIDLKRVVVTSVAAFVGQNISEIGKFSAKGKSDSLAKLFALYNERWITQVGTPGIRIVSK